MAIASSIYNLLRNLGGSFGVAFVTTMIARRAQFHQVHMVGHFSPFDRNYQIGVTQTARAIEYAGVDPSTAQQTGTGVIYGQLVKQAAMISFNVAFYLLSVFMIVILPLVLLMRTGKAEAPAGMH